eukprot:2003689-Amphidinium_carterae.1
MARSTFTFADDQRSTFSVVARSTFTVADDQRSTFSVGAEGGDSSTLALGATARQLQTQKSMPQAKGDEPPKRWRGGAPPLAPELTLSFEEASRDPSALRLWIRKVEAWQVRVQHWTPAEEHGLMLLERISGAGALLLQEIPLKEFATATGVEKIIECLRVLDPKPVQKVAQVLREYENLRRAPQELMRAYIARFMNAELKLQRLEVSAYSGQARAFKLLQGANITQHDTRQILASNDNEWTFDGLRKALEVQFPGVVPGGKDPRNAPPKGKHGGGKGKESAGKAHNIFVAEEAAAAAESEYPAATDECAVADLLEPLTHAAEVLSVTAQKLKSVTLA